MDNIEGNVIWTEEKCIQLIREYKSRTILWDCKEILFYKNAARSEEWESMGRALNINANDCKYKMNILMSSFRREKAKFKKSLLSGKSYVTSWFAFKELSFLMNRNLRKRNLIYKGDDSDDLSNISYIRELPDRECQYQSPNNTSQTVELPVPSEAIYVPDDTCDVDLKLEPESDAESELESCNQTTEDIPGPSGEKYETVKTYSVETSTDPINTEEIVAFTNFIQSKMKKYSEKTLTAVQKAICHILFKADDRYYENDMYEILAESDMGERFKTNIPKKRKRLSNLITIDRTKLQDSDSGD